jgi:hypothetical protein
MHTTTMPKRVETKLSINPNVKERAFNVATIIMMAARTGRIGDKRRKLRERDDHRLRD